MATQRPKLATITNENVESRMAGKSGIAVPVRATRLAMKEVGNKLTTADNANRVKQLPKEAQVKSANASPEPKPEPEDPFLCTEYINDILNYLRELEVKRAVSDDFLAAHETAPEMRAKLVDWLVEVHHSFSLCPETLHLCVSILDRYLQKAKNVGKSTLQLIGATALFIASKYEEVHFPPLDDFVYVCDNSFSANRFKRTEIQMMVALDYSLGNASSLQFLKRYCKVIQAKKEQYTMSKYMLELMLVSYATCHVRPSLQAAASFCLSLAITEGVLDLRKVWTRAMESLTTHKYLDIRPVMIDIAYILLNLEKSYCQGVRDKYASSKQQKISQDSKLLSSQLVRKLAGIKKN